MGKLIVLLVFIAIIVFIGFYVYSLIKQGLSQSKQMYWCACGCGRKMSHNNNWDGYHGPDLDDPVVWDAQMLENRPSNKKPKAIDYTPEGVIGWEDIQWTVEKKLKDER